MKNNNNNPKPLTGVEEKIDTKKIKIRKRGLDLKEREGVFAHSFICQHCGLHFNVYSWKPNKHRTDNTLCPECGQKGNFIHTRIKLSSNKQLNALSLESEIFKFCPIRGSSMMSDTTPKQK